MRLVWVLLCTASLLHVLPAHAARSRQHEAPGPQLFASPQARPIVVSADGSRVYVANTAARTVDVINADTGFLFRRIAVGLDPVGLALRPDELELWVSNHVSDSVSVIDLDPGSPSFLRVVETVQDLDANGVTDFDEPTGIAFASNAKAYVALSSTNRIAIVDATTYSVTGHLAISAQDPRALSVRGGRLYVLAFESGNQSELSACRFEIPGDPQCTVSGNDLGNAGADPNLTGVPKNVVRDPDVPDRDLFVFDVATDAPVGTPVVNVGTLLYDVAVSAAGEVFVTNTDARNHHLDGNGLAAPAPDGLGQGLADLGNFLFRNRVTRIDCSGASCAGAAATDLVEPVGSRPIATPYGVALSADDSVLLVTAAASSQLASLDAATLAVIDAVPVGPIPRGIAFHSTGATGTAYVLNTLGRSVSVVDVGAGGALTMTGEILVGADPAPEAVRLGRIAFNDSGASSSDSFACASCHPDAHVDHLLWVIGAQCTDCVQEEPRLTMPIRGLSRTIPLHWDGTLGDPFGGPNGEVGLSGSAPANCSLASGEQACFRQLVDAAVGGVMCTQPTCPTGPSGMPGELDGDERENMASFLQAVSYPPARLRRMDDAVTPAALDGFADFFMDQGGNGGSLADSCADTEGGCHALPLGVATNSAAVGGFEAPTMRGMTDRFIHFSAAFVASQEILDLAATSGGSNGVIPWDPVNQGFDELTVFSAGFLGFEPAYGVFPGDMFQMFEEASVGHSGATGRQVTLNTATALSPDTIAIMDALEAADLRGVVNLRADGIRNGKGTLLSFRGDGAYKAGSLVLTPAQLRSEAAAGTTLVTLTAALRSGMGASGSPQPLVSTAASGAGPTGDPPLPVLPGGPMELTAIDVGDGAALLVDGDVVGGTITCVGGSYSPFCDSERIDVELDVTPANGTHLLQLQNPAGLLSPELPFCVGPAAGCL